MMKKNGKTFYLLDSVDAFSVGIGHRFEIAGNDIAVFRVGETFRAFGNRCPHQGASLCKGSLKQGCRIECPAHGWTFDVVTGRRILHPEYTIPTYEAIVHDAQVWVCIDTCLYVPNTTEESAKNQVGSTVAPSEPLINNKLPGKPKIQSLQDYD